MNAKNRQSSGGGKAMLFSGSAAIQLPQAPTYFQPHAVQQAHAHEHNDRVDGITTSPLKRRVEVPPILPVSTPTLVALRAIAELGVDRGFRRAGVIAVSSLMGGAYVSLGCALFCRTLAESGGSILLGAVVFPVGFCFALSSGADLLTTNLLYGLMPILLRDPRRTWEQKKRNVLRLIALSGVWNLCACVLLAWLCSFTVLVDREILQALAARKLSPSPYSIFVKGIVANWLVNLAVFLSLCESDSVARLFRMWLPISTFVALGMEHSIANAFYLPLAVFMKAAPEGSSFASVFTANVLPCFAGNIAGSILFVVAQTTTSTEYGVRVGS